MLILANIGKAELKPTALATKKLLCRRSKDWRKFIVDNMQDPSIRVDNMVDGWS